MLSEIFWSFIATSLIGLVLKLSSMAYKSKCKEFEFCCIKVKRDIDAETQLDGIELNKITDNSNTK